MKVKYLGQSPKYKIKHNGTTFLSQTLKTFSNYKNYRFIFITFSKETDIDFIKISCASHDIKNYEIIVLENRTRGQAETVIKGLASLLKPTEEILVFNVDTYIANLTLPNLDFADGWISTFISDGYPRWSYVKQTNGKVESIIEKKVISKYASTGLYYFKRFSDYILAYKETKEESIANYGEIYISALYNHMIKENKNIIMTVESDVTCLDK